MKWPWVSTLYPWTCGSVCCPLPWTVAGVNMMNYDRLLAHLAATCFSVSLKTLLPTIISLRSISSSSKFSIYFTFGYTPGEHPRNIQSSFCWIFTHLLVNIDSQKSTRTTIFASSCLGMSWRRPVAVEAIGAKFHRHGRSWGWCRYFCESLS